MAFPAWLFLSGIVTQRYTRSCVVLNLCMAPPRENTYRRHSLTILRTDMGKIFAITTDGAPAMVGKSKGFTKMVEDKIGHPILKLHCIVHQENLCAKISSSDLNRVITTVTKVVNFLVAHTPLTHRQFQAFLEEVDSVYKDIPLHCSVRWLSCGNILERFVECFDETQIFLLEKGQDYPELEDRLDCETYVSLRHHQNSK